MSGTPYQLEARIEKGLTPVYNKIFKNMTGGSRTSRKMRSRKMKGGKSRSRKMRGGRNRSRKMKGGMPYGGPLSPHPFDGQGVGTSGVGLQFVAGNAG